MRWEPNDLRAKEYAKFILRETIFLKAYVEGNIESPDNMTS